jgi:Protein of unknown function DUF47
VTREVLTALRRTFMTPLDRGDIKDLITSMDDAIAPEEFLCGTEAGLRSLASARVMQGVGIGKRETKTAETSSTCRVMNRIPGPSVIG